MDIYDQKFYVYYIIDPETYLPIYVGKGSGKRIYSHLQVSAYKRKFIIYNKIKQIRSRGYEPILKIWKTFSDENQAHSYEKFLISVWGRKCNSTGILYNQTDGGEGVSGHKKNFDQK